MTGAGADGGAAGIDGEYDLNPGDPAFLSCGWLAMLAARANSLVRDR
jgi:hypothetical protein